MHSSRMRTVRCSSRLLGGGCLPGEGVCLPNRGWGWESAPRGQTDTCENITFPQLLLRTVKRNVTLMTIHQSVHAEW